MLMLKRPIVPDLPAYPPMATLSLSWSAAQEPPQGTVLVPFLFNLYISDFSYSSELCHLQKYADDSVIVGCVREGQEGEYRGLFDDFAEWCRQNHLHLNIKKTKEKVIDFKKKKNNNLPSLYWRGGCGDCMVL